MRLCEEYKIILIPYMVWPILRGQMTKLVKIMFVKTLTSLKMDSKITKVYINATACHAEELHFYLKRCGQTKMSKVK